MVKKILIYGLTVYILGLFFSGLTLALLQFVPYFVSGLIITTPIYGAVRKHTEKGRKLTFGGAQIKKGAGYMFKFSKTSATILAVLAVVIFNAHNDIIEILFPTTIAGVVTLIVTFVIWEITRIAVKKVDNVHFISFGEAVKGAF